MPGNSAHPVLVYGDDATGSGSECYARALTRLGLDVSMFSDWAGLDAYSKLSFGKVFRRLYHRLLEKDRRRHVALLLAEVQRKNPKLIVIQKGLHLAPEDVRKLRNQDRVVVNVNHDDFFSQNPLNWSRVQREAIPEYNAILTTREVNVEEIRPFNKNVEFFPFAYDSLIHRPVPIPSSESHIWNVDVVFVGTFAEHRAKLLEYLVTTVPATYSIWGGQWMKLRRNSPLVPFIKNQPVYKDDLCKAFGGAKISLGFLRKENRDEYTQRTFEIPACGGLLLTERTPTHKLLYKEGIEADFFDADECSELCYKVRTLLNNDELRLKIRTAGKLAVTHGQNNYDHRADRLIKLIQ